VQILFLASSIGQLGIEMMNADWAIFTTRQMLLPTFRPVNLETLIVQVILL
jgi:hypothetical protein